MTSFRTLVFLALGGLAACTTFNGLSADDGGPPAAKKDSGLGDDDDTTDATTGQDGAADAARDAMAEAGQPVTYLTIPAAAKLCTRFQTCDFLSDSVQDSMGIPVIATETQNYSACVDILAGPLPPTRPGIALQSLVLGCVINASTCTEAKACLSYEDLDSKDARCLSTPNAEVCQGNDQVLCDYSSIFHCGNAAYVGSECLSKGDAGVECVKDDSCPVNSTCSTPTVSDYCTDIGGHAQFDCSIYGDYCDIATDDAGSDFSDCFQAKGEEQGSCDVDKTSCDANGRVSVCGGAVVSVYDCNAIGEKCLAGASSVSCVPPGAACNPSSAGINVCTDDQISVCVGGVKSMVDCTQFGAHCFAPGLGLNSYCAPTVDGGDTDAD
jgi:hypothetical protein